MATVAKLNIRVAGHVVLSRSGDISQRLQRNGDKLAKETANFIRDTSMGLAPVRTGRLKNSIHVNQRTDAGVYEVVVGAPYGIYVNNGTRYMHAQPFFTQAVALGRDYFSVRVQRLLT